MAKTMGALSNAQHLVDQNCADFPRKLGSVKSSPTARHFWSKLHEQQVFSRSKMRRFTKGVGFLKECAKNLFLVEVAPIFQGS